MPYSFGASTYNAPTCAEEVDIRSGVLASFLQRPVHLLEALPRSALQGRPHERHEDAMTNSTIRLLAVLAAALTGILTGASLDQSIKQLPARRRIGVVSYAAYAGAADLGNGIVWYAVLGVGAALLCLVVALIATVDHLHGSALVASWVSAGLALAHSFTTTQAAPTMFRSKKFLGNEPELERIFNRFAHWQTARATLQVLNFGAAVWCLLLLWGG
jgi:hypothetical protein